MKAFLGMILGVVLLPYSAIAGINEFVTFYNKVGNDQVQYGKMARMLAEDGYYFAATPLLKSYLVSQSQVHQSQITDALDLIATSTGLKHFEILPDDVLRKSEAPVIRYILAKKEFRRKNYDAAAKLVHYGTPEKNVIKPFALNLEASIFAITNRNEEALSLYDQCIDSSDSFISKAKSGAKRQQLIVNRDYCIVGKARVLFADKKYGEATLAYLDLPKQSPVWPSILFEEGWNSFYAKDYNRTLGKLVTYNAPVFTHIFNPEIEVLRSLTYYEMCLWDDVRVVVDDFDRKYGSALDSIDNILNKYSKNYDTYYNLVQNYSLGKRSGHLLFDTYINAITRDDLVNEMMEALRDGEVEYQKIEAMKNSSAKQFLLQGAREGISMHKKLIGGFVRKRMFIYQEQLRKALQGMSYMKLEVLSRKKSEIYADAPLVEKRGDIANLVRNEKQYFWNFNGEFWADELGDYVFSLKSECK